MTDSTSGIIDNRNSGDLTATGGGKWRLISDQVMGGVSSGELTVDNYKGRRCLRMRGDVSTENNGGFIQMALALSAQGDFDATGYSGIELAVSGNNERYNIHLRTSDLWLPWQSYRAEFTATDDWQIMRIPFSRLQPYKTGRQFSQHKLARLGLVAIGRNFSADLCLANIRFYKQ